MNRLTQNDGHQNTSEFSRIIASICFYHVLMIWLISLVGIERNKPEAHQVPPPRALITPPTHVTPPTH